MKLRLLVLLVMSLLAVGVFPALAQDTPMALNCLDLSEDDCELVTASITNTHDIQSFTVDFTFSQVSGNTEVAIEGLNSAITAEGTAMVAVDHDAETEESPYAGLSMALELSGQESNAGGEQSGQINVVIVDGNIYLQNTETGEWRGTSLADLSEEPDLMNITIMGMPVPALQAMQLGMDAGMDTSSTNVTGLLALFQTPGFLSQTREADETLEGQDMAVFTYTGELGAVLSSEAVQAEISELAAQAGGSSNPMAQQLSAMLPVLLQNTTGQVKLSRWIGLDDQLPHRVTLDIHVEVDLFGGASSTNATPIPPITFDINIAADLSEINNTPTPTAPESATIVPADEFLPQPEAAAS
jgi:hypothetical protein